MSCLDGVLSCPLDPVLSGDLELCRSSCVVGIVVGGTTPAAEQTTDEDEEKQTPPDAIPM